MNKFLEEIDMKNSVKKMIVGALITTSFPLLSAVHNLGERGYTGRYCEGNTLSYNVGGEYVERILISTEGIRNDGFIKVYADGELVHNLGVPGYDPDYSFRVRRVVQNISLKFERSCFRIHDLKIFTEDHGHHQGYRHYRPTKQEEVNWGFQLVEMVNSLSKLLVFRSDYQTTLWPSILLPLKKLGLAQGTRDFVKDPESLETAYYSLLIAAKIVEMGDFLESMSVGDGFDQFQIDLLLMKEDILERYDVKERKLSHEINELKTILEL